MVGLIWIKNVSYDYALVNIVMNTPDPHYSENFFIKLANIRFPNLLSMELINYLRVYPSRGNCREFNIWKT
jgi:hypothetical protein